MLENKNTNKKESNIENTPSKKNDKMTCLQRTRTRTHTRQDCMRTTDPVAMRFLVTHSATLNLICSKILASKMDSKQQRRPTDFHVHW